MKTGYHEHLPIDNRVLGDPGSFMLEDVIIYDSDNEPVLVKVDLSYKQGAIDFIRGLSFYDRAHFCDSLKEFAILNNFEL